MSYACIDKPCRVALFAPASPVGSEKLKVCLKIIEEKAPWIEIINDVFIDQIKDKPLLPYLVGKDQRQADRFTSLLLDPSIDFIWCLRGGYGSLRWLSLVPWEQTCSTNPLIIGFSDVSFLQCVLFRHAHFSIHGPLISTLPITTEPARKALWTCLKKGRFPHLSGITLNPGKAKGQLIGGNLSCITHLIGTNYEPVWDGAILLIEDHNEAVYSLDRMLTQLLLTGRLSKLAGIAVGQLLGFKKPKMLLQILLQDRFTSLKIPIVTDLPVGHTPNNYPLLIGGYYELDGYKGLLKPMTKLHRS
jgi:muramoyltetrapeptide carboxypeptidase